MRHQLSTVVFTQGWLTTQFESALEEARKTENENPTPALVAAQIREQWKVIDESLDDLIKKYQEMERQLAIIKSALL